MKRLAKKFFILAGAVSIVILMSLVLHRLIITNLPDYQAEIEAWARQELGLTVQFTGLNARFGILGPELILQDARVSAMGDEENSILSAREVQLDVSALALLMQRKLEISRLILQGTALAVERAFDGNFRLQNIPENNSETTFLPEDVPPIEILIMDSSVTYEDQILGIAWRFQNVRAEFSKSLDGIALEARADAPEELGGLVEVSVEVGLLDDQTESERNWRLFGEIRDFDLAVLPILISEPKLSSVVGVGDIDVWLDMTGFHANQGTMQLALTDVGLGNGEIADYDSFGLTAEWVSLENGWTLSVNNLDLSRSGRSWPANVSIDARVINDEDGFRDIELDTGFLQLEDIFPLLSVVTDSNWASVWEGFMPSGQLFEVDFSLGLGPDAQWDYSISSTFNDIGISSNGLWPGLTNLSGDIRADSRIGRLSITSEDSLIESPTLFPERIQTSELSGVIDWWQGEDALRVASKDFIINTYDARSETSLELIYPWDHSSPVLDLVSSIDDFNLNSMGTYLPKGVMSPNVYQYLVESISGGQIRHGDIDFSGPLHEFPFDNGDGLFEVRLQIENGLMNYLADWPSAEGLTGTLEFLNAGWSAQGSGRVLGNETEDLIVGIEDVRNPILSVSAQTTGPLDDVLRFLNEAPLVAQQLGPDLARLSAQNGAGNVEFNLTLPLRNPSDYILDTTLGIVDGEVSIIGFRPTVDEINGVLVLQDKVLNGELEATFLDGPLIASVNLSDDPGYFANITFDGQIDIQVLHEEFDIPFDGYLEGNTHWQGNLFFPSSTYTQVRREPLKISVGSTLSGVQFDLPEPLKKSFNDSTSLQLDFVFSEFDRLDVSGHLGAERRFALSFRNQNGDFSFRRGTVYFGGGYPFLPPRDGLVVNGALEQLRLEEWWSFLDGEAHADPLSSHLLGVDLEITDLTFFGQRLGFSNILLRQDPVQWRLQIDSEPVAGIITLPLEFMSRPQITAQLERLKLSTEDFVSDAKTNPRDLPGLVLEVNDFSFGSRQFGSLNANIQTDALGLNLESFETKADSFTIKGSGSWLQGGAGPSTQLSLSLSSTDVALTLQQLSLDPVADALSGNAALSVNWLDAPFADWTQSVSGDVSLQMERGSILDLEPGAGRLMGMMSITALPRRLALDFREFDRGLVFDEVSGDFLIINGNAYTDNLYLTGPVADIGLVGRTGLHNKDYQQQAVVTAEPGKILPAMGFLAGPQIGTAVLIFTQIFQESLKGIGRASYCVTGSWDNPDVERLTLTELQANKFCADLPEGTGVLQ